MIITLTLRSGNIVKMKSDGAKNTVIKSDLKQMVISVKLISKRKRKCRVKLLPKLFVETFITHPLVQL